MKNQIKSISKKQEGAATLFISVVLLICITLVTILTSKTVLQETKMTANNYRAAQAIANADAAMDYALAYFKEHGLDNDGDTILDDVDLDVDGIDEIQTAFPSFTDGTLAIEFDNNDGVCTTDADLKSALIIARGISDDEVARRSISQCVGSINIFSAEGPQQPLISKGAVGLTGNVKVVNRINNTTVWSGLGVDIGNSSSASTWVWPHTAERPDVYDASLTDAERDAIVDIFEDTSNPIQDASIVSTKDMGLGVDIVENDATLDSLTADEFFEGFFPSGKDAIKQLAENVGDGQALDVDDADYDLGDLDGQSGIMWVDGDVDMSGLTIGTADHPAALIINGNLRVTGNPVIHGVLYIVGQLDAAGTVKVIGSTIVEGDNATMVAGGHAGEDPVVGTGGIDLTYSPFTQNESENGLKGTAVVISGSWNDWAD